MITPGPESILERDAWEMLCAARAGDGQAIRTLLARDVGLVHAEYGGVQPIHIAVCEGRLQAARILLDAGADPTQIVDQASLRMHASDRGFGELAELLGRAAETWTDLVAPGNSDHAIHKAASANDAETVRALLRENEQLLEQADDSGGSPLHRAVAASAEEVATLLLDSGADIHARHGAGRASSRGYPPILFEPIDLALWTGPFWNVRGDMTTARLLLRRGARYDLVIASALGDAVRVRGILDDDPKAITAARPSGKHALPAAVEFAPNVATLLLEHGASPNWPDGRTAPRGSALHAAARRGYEKMVSLLLDYGADPNAWIEASGSATFVAKTPAIRRLLMRCGGQLSPYDLAWLGEDDAVIARVREEPASAHAGCGGVLAAACRLGNRDLLVRLLQNGVRVRPVVTECRSYYWEHPAFLDMLLAHGMDPNLPDFQCTTPLHSLCSLDNRGRARLNRTTCARILLEHGANINATEEAYQSTPLGWAARVGLADMAALLLEHGADINGGADWATPLSWAERRNHLEVVRILRRARA